MRGLVAIASGFFIVVWLMILISAISAESAEIAGLSAVFLSAFIILILMISKTRKM